ncbi:LLM class flavin-dependent oxidoreductase [Kribbella jejuensis]|uniref:Luciferase-like monooxygenase n=1 Tax=Kribbella jejuensis TaxID=236068 RepID=A0A542EMA2_9ACTN|nr:LLM class flavin-dependent oxidoreductase [Kribbella jejuensis]TQJ16467.1 luciferase-like monooxygenase [Kribbella jejuensis]
MPPTFGLKTTPMHVPYADIRRVWLEADEYPQLRDAWLWDHFLPLAGPKDGDVLEGWTLLTALAAQTTRLRLGLLVTSNRIRPPAVLGKIASTLDVISGGRLIMGLGVGGTHQSAGLSGVPGPNPAIEEYAAYGLTLVPPGEGVDRLRETIQILRRMWTEDEFDYHGRYYTLERNRNSPKPVQQGGPPLLIGGWGNRMLRLVARYADQWNISGPPHTDFATLADRVHRLDMECERIGRDPSTVSRSLQQIVSYDDPAGTRAIVEQAVGLGFDHIVLSLPRPYPEHVVRWLIREIVDPFH